MPYMTWNVWYRSKGARKWMDKTTFGGVTFSNIFYDGMRSVFFDENNNKGLLYKGAVYAASQDIVNNRNKGKRIGFSEKQQQTFLRDGVFKYNSSSWFFDQRLRIEGPDENDPGFAKTLQNGNTVLLNFYKIIDLATTHQKNFQGTVVPLTAAGAHELAFFTAAVMMHEMMHEHSFDHPREANPDVSPGSDYACTLPFVAYLSVLFAAKTVLPNYDLPQQFYHPVGAGSLPSATDIFAKQNVD